MILDNDVLLQKVLDSHRLLLVHTYECGIPLQKLLDCFCMVHSEVLDNDVVLRNFHILYSSYIASGAFLGT